MLITCELILKSCTVLVVVDKIFYSYYILSICAQNLKKRLKETKSATMNVFRKKKSFLFKSFVKVKLSYIFTNCMIK